MILVFVIRLVCLDMSSLVKKKISSICLTSKLSFSLLLSEPVETMFLFILFCIFFFFIPLTVCHQSLPVDYTPLITMKNSDASGEWNCLIKYILLRVCYASIYFPYKSPTPIQGEPTYKTLKRLKNELRTNASSVDTDLGGGDHGYLRLVLTDAEYARVAPKNSIYCPRFSRHINYPSRH